MNITINNTSIENLTYGQLKSMVPGTGKGRVPKCREALKDNPAVVIAAESGSATITVYSNGFFIYKSGGKTTVQGVDRCEKDMAAFLNPEVAGHDDADVNAMSWIFPLEISGSSRMEENAERIEDGHRMFSLSDDADVRNEQLSHRPEHEVAEEEMEEQALVGQLRCALENLSARQKEIVLLHYYKGMDQKTIAGLLGIRQQNVSKNLIRAIEKLKKISGGWV